MKKIVIAALFINNILFACSKSASENNQNNNDNTDPAKAEPGIAKGRVTDTKGRPIAGARINVDNSIYFNSGISTTTDANGYYRVQVPQGSWYVYARIAVTYHGKTFEKIELHPDVSTSFAGTNGAVRNFQWKLTGEKPIPMAGHYGGLVNLYNDPDCELWDVENIEFTFTPDGPLIDGSIGTVIRAKSGQPRTDNFKKIPDIPMGRYTVTAKHLPTGKIIKLAHNDGQNNYSNSITIDFEPALNFCDRCMVIVYTDK